MSNSASNNESAYKNSNIEQKKESKTPGHDNSNDISIAFSDDEDFQKKEQQKNNVSNSASNKNVNNLRKQ